MREKCNDCKCLLKVRKYLCTPINGKLSFSKEIELPQNNSKTVEFVFDIHNEYQPCDKLVWTFQEISKDVKITIIKDAGCYNIPFFVRINHPAVLDIMREINPEYEVDKNTGKLKKNRTVIPIRRTVLPYQGFEIYWEAEEVVTNDNE